MNPEDLRNGSWYKSRPMFIEARGEGISTCRRKGPNGELTQRTYDYVVASQSLQEKIKTMEVVEDFESRPHKAVTFLMERDTEIQELRELKMPTALPGCNGGKLLGKEAESEKKRKCEGWRTR